MILKRRQDIERFLAKPDPEARATVLYGPDAGVVRERAVALAARVTRHPDDPFDVARLTQADIEADLARLHGELAAVSMMGGRRLVRLRLDDERAGADRLAAEALADHLAGTLNPEAFFLVEARDLPRDSPLRRVAEKAAECIIIPCYEDEAVDFARFTREALSGEGLSLDTEALELFVSRLPHERGVARQEIERLILFLGPAAGGRPASADSLTEFLGVEPAASLAEAASDAFGGRLGAAQAGLRRAAREGEGGPAAVRALGMHLARLRRAITLRMGGATAREAAKGAFVFWKNEAEFLRQARLWRLADLQPVQGDLVAADLACKSAGAPDQLIAERAALSIAGKARRLGL